MASEAFPISIPSLSEPFHTGSVQKLHAVPDRPDLMVSETTAAGSVFDVGSIFEIEGSDVTRALFRHVLFGRLAEPAEWERVRDELRGKTSGHGDLPDQTLERLADRGVATHHVGMLDDQSGELVSGTVPARPSRFNVVRRFQVHHPSRHRVPGGSVFDYLWFTRNDRYVIPLEYLVRFGITTGSSIWKRYRQAGEEERGRLLSEWGVRGAFEPWRLLERPLVDCSSKYEPEDRAVSRQEALMMSGLEPGLFSESLELALLGGHMVRLMVAEIGLDLWDLKWELARERGELVFVDTVDTDSIRATLATEVDGTPVAVHVNKQAMRDYYRICHASWLEGVDRAKARAAADGVPFAEVLEAGVERGEFPPVPEVDKGFAAIQADKLRAVRDWLCGRLDPAQVRSALVDCAQAEAEFYRGRGSLGEWLSLTATEVATNREVGSG